MIIKELIAELQKMDPHRLVVMSSDGEGNNYSPLADLSACGYRADSTWSGYTGPEELTAELKDHGYTDEDVIADGEAAVCLYPTN